MLYLVTRERNLNFEKDIDGCRGFTSVHDQVSLANVADIVLKSKFSSILMDGSAIHEMEKESIYSVVS